MTVLIQNLILFLQETFSHLCKSTSRTTARAPLAPLQEHLLHLCKIPSCTTARTHLVLSKDKRKKTELKIKL